MSGQEREALEAVVSRVLKDAGIPEGRKSPEARAVREGWNSAMSYRAAFTAREEPRGDAGTCSCGHSFADHAAMSDEEIELGECTLCKCQGRIYEPWQMIFFSGSIKLPIPDYTSIEDVRQLVQDELGHAGAIVEDIIEHER